MSNFVVALHSAPPPSILNAHHTTTSMLALSSLNKLLSHILSPPALHTAVLFTASGAVVSYATTGGAGNSSDPLSPSRPRPKDDIRVLVGLASQVWAETKEDGEGLVDSEVILMSSLCHFVLPPATFFFLFYAGLRNSFHSARVRVVRSHHRPSHRPASQTTTATRWRYRHKKQQQQQQ